MKFIQILLLTLLLTNFATAIYIIESSEGNFLDTIFSWFSDLGNSITGLAILSGGEETQLYVVEVGDVVTLTKGDVVTYTSGQKFQLLSIFDKNNALLLNIATGKELLLERGKPNEESPIDLLVISLKENLVFTSGIVDYYFGVGENIVYTTPGNSFMILPESLLKIYNGPQFMLKQNDELKVLLVRLDEEAELLLSLNEPVEFEGLEYELLSVDPLIINVDEVSGCKQGELLIPRGEIEGAVVYQCVSISELIDINKIPEGCFVPVCNSDLEVVGQEANGCLQFKCPENLDCESLPLCKEENLKLTRISGDCLIYYCLTICEEPPVCAGYLVIASWQGDCAIYSCEVQEVECTVPLCEGTLNVIETDADGCSIYECEYLESTPVLEESDISSECSSIECSGIIVDTGAINAFGCSIYACQELVVESGEFNLEISLETGELSGENVHVYILNEQWVVLDKSITDSSGRTTFSLLPETYVIMVDNAKYFLAQEKLTLETNTMLEIYLEPSASVPCPMIQQPLLQAGCIAIPIKNGACITGFDVSCSEDIEEVIILEDTEEVEQIIVISIKPTITEQRPVQVIELVETVKEVLVKDTCKSVCTVLCGGFNGCGGQCPADNINTPGECGNPSIEEIEAENVFLSGTSNTIATFFKLLFS